MIRKSFLSLFGLVLVNNANADWALNMPKGVTELSKETYDLHMMVFWWCVAIGVVVFGVMIISLFKHRKSKGAEPADFSHSTAAEVIWTAIPVVILLIMAVPAAETMIKAEDSRNPDISIVVTAYQWKCHYKYQDEGIEFYSSLARPSLDERRLNAGVDVNTVPGITNTPNLEVAYDNGIPWSSVKGWTKTEATRGQIMRSEFIPNPDYVPAR